MPSTTAESTIWVAERAELQAILQSPLFARSPTLTHFLSYLCEKTFAGETDQIKEYSIALDVFDRSDSFDQDTDSIVRVQANRLRKRLSEYYTAEGTGHSIRITIPVGQYVPLFQRVATSEPQAASIPTVPERSDSLPEGWYVRPWAFWIAISTVAIVVGLGLTFLARESVKPPPAAPAINTEPAEAIGLPVGEEIHILAGSNRKYVDHAGKVWNPDAYFSGGSALASTVQHIWRTQDPIIYRSSRQGDFSYNIPLKPGTYELRLHFAETFYGPENAGGGGEGSRTMAVTANGRVLLEDFDALADAGDGRTAEVKVFPDISPAADGQLHLVFTSGKSGSAMVSAIEILPGIRGKPRPVRIVARDVPYYSNDSRWWSPDAYFKGGQLSTSQESTLGTDDPEFYESERWGHFSYAIPVPPGRYSVTLHLIDHGSPDNSPQRTAPGASSNAGQKRVFSVFCNGKTVLSNLDIIGEAGRNHPLVRRIKGLVPNAQGKLLLEFVPVTGYATISAIEVVPE